MNRTEDEFRNLIQDLTHDIEELLVIKNRKYGNSFDKTRDKYGPLAFVLRLEDKFNRVFSLIKNDDVGTFDESIEYTIKDIIGYCVLEILYREENAKKIKEVIDKIV